MDQHPVGRQAPAAVDLLDHRRQRLSPGLTAALKTMCVSIATAGSPYEFE